MWNEMENCAGNSRTPLEGLRQGHSDKVVLELRPEGSDAIQA